ncbi:MAG: fibronectin type III domain-containing protein [Carboxylicivirga sp.]|jgi:hypothetical protein|nr:fibronectin type III domain-containing protein [Carboxylicivirga sp.]
MKKAIIYLSVFLTGLCLNTSCESDEVEVEIKPANISIEAINTTEHTTTVNFNQVEGVLSYDMEYGLKNQELKYEVSIDAGKNLTYNLKELKADCNYTVKIIAKNTGGANIGEGTLDFKTNEVPEKIVGTWENECSGQIVVYHFNNDGFGTYKYHEQPEKVIMWSATSEGSDQLSSSYRLTITTYSKGIGSTSSTETVDCKISFGKFIIFKDTSYLKK